MLYRFRQVKVRSRMILIMKISMKRILYILPLALAVMTSCKEDTLDVYHGPDYVHFTPGANDAAEVSFNFALDTKTTRETEALIHVQIRLWGYLPKADFKCNVSVDPTSTALATDYDDISSATFRKGYDVDTLWVKVKRRNELLATDYKIVVNMDDAGSAHVVAPAKYKKVTITVKDEITSEPVWWGTTQNFGEYSPIKYRLLNLYLGKVLKNINEYTNISLKEEALNFKAWLKNNWETYKYYHTDGVTPLYDTIPE